MAAARRGLVPGSRCSLAEILEPEAADDLPSFLGKVASDAEALVVTENMLRFNAQAGNPADVNAGAVLLLLGGFDRARARVAQLEAALAQFKAAWDDAASGFDGLSQASADDLDAAAELAGELLTTPED